MAWFKVDDGFWSHPKVLELSPEAGWLWVRAGAYSAQQLTDGLVTRAALRMLGGERDHAVELVLAGLWDEAENGGFRFHDWDVYQPSREVVEERRRVRAEAGRKGGLRSGQSRREANAEANASAGASANGEAESNPVPSRPDDFYKTSKSQSRNNRARVSTDAIEVSPMTKQLAAQQGITNLRTVVDAIYRATGLTVTADQAFQVSVWLLGKAKEAPSAPQRYVIAAVAKSPFEVQKHIHEGAA